MDENASWWRKMRRAEKHLIDFNEIADEYIATDPYRMVKRIEGHGKRERWVHRLEIDPVPDDLPLIAGDFLFNVRSALDHVAVASAPRKNRWNASFPIFIENIWERDASGAYLQRYTDARATWHRITGGMSDDALAIIQSVQPYNATAPDPSGIGVKNQLLALLSSYQNADKHRELAIVGGHLNPTHIPVTLGDGRRGELTTDNEDGSPLLLQHDAELPIAPTIDPATVHVEIEGTVKVLIGREGMVRATDTWLVAETTFKNLMGYVIHKAIKPLAELLG